LRLTSRDLLKFGLLYINNGNCNGTQILDTSWVSQSFKSFIERPDLKKYKIKEGGYGYQFWTYLDTLNAQPINIIEAKGKGGQSIFFCNSLNLSVVTTGGNYNQEGSDPYLMLTKFILPSIYKKSAGRQHGIQNSGFTIRRQTNLFLLNLTDASNNTSY